MNIVIEKNVPMPVFRGAFAEVVAKMEVGDSIPNLSKNQALYVQQISKRLNRTASAQKSQNGVFRVWRVK